MKSDILIYKKKGVQNYPTKQKQYDLSRPEIA